MMDVGKPQKISVVILARTLQTWNYWTIDPKTEIDQMLEEVEHDHLDTLMTDLGIAVHPEGTEYL